MDEILTKWMDSYMANARRPELEDCRLVCGVVLPHGGILHTGSITAQAIALLRDRMAHQVFDSIVLIGFLHHDHRTEAGFVKRLLMPEGSICMDVPRNLKQQVNTLRTSSDASFVNIFPWIQRFLPDVDHYALVLNPTNVDGTVSTCLGLLETQNPCFVASTDLSHGLTLSEAMVIDMQVLRAIETLSLRTFPLITGLVAAELGPTLCLESVALAKGWNAQVLDYSTSVPGIDPEQQGVVGYGVVSYCQ